MRFEAHVFDLEANDLRYPCSSVVHQHQQQLIPLARQRSGVRRIEDSLHLVTSKVTDIDAIEPLHRNGQDALGHREKQWVGGRRMAKERADSGEASVATAGAVAPGFLQV